VRDCEECTAATCEGCQIYQKILKDIELGEKIWQEALAWKRLAAACLGVTNAKNPQRFLP
jgi:hypothetical protein